jgi:lipopolysaccharide export system ATP-binding protein
MAVRLIATGLQKTYGRRQVVKDVSLDVSVGEVVGLLGPNGAGKTTSFYMVVGLVRSDAGTITLGDVPIHKLPIHQRSRMGLSYLPQEASIFRKLTVAENVRAVLELQTYKADTVNVPTGSQVGEPLTKADIESRLASLLKELRVDHLKDSSALSLSRWPPSRALCCWMNRLLAWIRLL